MAVALCALLALDQLVQHTALSDGVFLGQWVIPFDPPLFTEWQKARVADMAAIAAGDEELAATSIYDRELGWCPRPGQRIGRYAYDWSGSRLAQTELARHKDPARRRVVAIGGSFTQGVEVEASESWVHLFAARLDVELANLGVAGYGVDQAYLRLLRDGLSLEPDEVWLGLMPEAALRLSTNFPPVYRHWSSVVAFKPLFRLDGAGRLTEVANPATDLARAVELLEDQRAFVAAVGGSDFWVRRAPRAFAPRGSDWTHWLASTRLLVTALEGGGRGTARYLGPPETELHRVMLALVRAIDEACRGAGARLRVLVLPSQPDLQDAERRGTPYWSTLARELADGGIEVLDVGPRLLEVGAADDDEGRYWMPQSHYSPLANRIVADELARLCGAR